MSAIVVDVADGFRDAWAAHAINSSLPVARVYYDQAPAVTAVPYVVFTVDPQGEAEYSTGSSTYIVHALLTVKVYAAGMYSSLKTIVDAVASLMSATFAISNTTLMAFFVVDAGTVKADGVRDQEQIYRGEMKYRLVLSRNDG